MDRKADLERLGKYEIRGVLGRGAMGVVYDGWDPGIVRRVAIKTLTLPDAADTEAQEKLARFKREAQAAGRLTHPNIVGLFDYGETADLAYLVMEFVDGQTLRAALDDKRRFAPADVLPLMDDLLAGLQYSHDRGVVHRDIKPANLILTHENRLKIADFGIARIESSDLTQDGTVMGTPAYMSAEQFMGQVVDRRTDIYSAGVLLYHLLTGERPFDGSMTAIMHKALNTEPPPPSQLSVAVPASLDPVVARAMAKRPDGRYATATAFAHAIHAAFAPPGGLLDRPVTGPVTRPAAGSPADGDATLVVPPAQRSPSAPSARPAAAARRSRAAWPILAGAAVLLAGAAGGGAWYVTHNGPPVPVPQGDRPRPSQDGLSGPSPDTRQPSAPPGQPGPGSIGVGRTDEARVPPATDQAPPGSSNTPGQDAAPARGPDQAAPVQPSPAQAGPGPVVPGRDAPVPGTPPVGTAGMTDPGQGQAPPPTLGFPGTADRGPPAETAPPAVGAGSLKGPDNPPAKAPEAQVASAPDLTMLRRRIAAAVASVPCAVLTADVTGPGSVTLSGVADAKAEPALRRAVAAADPTVALTWQVQSFSGPYCRAVEIVRPIGTRAAGLEPGLSISPKDDRSQLAKDDYIVVDAALPAFESYLTVDYLQQDGKVYHMHPSTAYVAVPYPASSRKVLGELRPDFAGWQIGTPFGTDIVIAIASSEPLQLGTYPDGVPADAYVRDLQAAVDAAQRRGVRLSGTALILRTREVR